MLSGTGECYSGSDIKVDCFPINLSFATNEGVAWFEVVTQSLVNVPWPFKMPLYYGSEASGLLDL